MHGGRPRGDEQRLSNLVVALSLRYELEHLELSRRQSVTVRVVGWCEIRAVEANASSPSGLANRVEQWHGTESFADGQRLRQRVAGAGGIPVSSRHSASRTSAHPRSNDWPNVARPSAAAAPVR